jgi:hypothetical protein
MAETRYPQGCSCNGAKCGGMGCLTTTAAVPPPPAAIAVESDAALINAFVAHNDQFHRSSEHPRWLYCMDGDGNSTSLRGDMFATALRNVIKEFSV